MSVDKISPMLAADAAVFSPHRFTHALSQVAVGGRAIDSVVVRTKAVDH